MRPWTALCLTVAITMFPQKRESELSLHRIIARYNINISEARKNLIPTSYYDDYTISIRRPENETVSQMNRRILAAVERPITFAGKYAIVVWSCGAGCIDGAIVNQTTKAIYDLPFHVYRTRFLGQFLRFSSFSGREGKQPLAGPAAGIEA